MVSAVNRRYLVVQVSEGNALPILVPKGTDLDFTIKVMNAMGLRSGLVEGNVRNRKRAVEAFAQQSILESTPIKATEPEGIDTN